MRSITDLRISIPSRVPGWELVAVACLVAIGCTKGTPGKVLHGTVTCGGENVAFGQVAFLPLDNRSTPGFAATIVDGQYRIPALRGVPLGKYRVCIDARRRSDRKVQGFNGMEMATVDEEVRMGPPAFAGQESPLVVELRADFQERFDIAIPP